MVKQLSALLLSLMLALALTACGRGAAPPPDTPEDPPDAPVEAEPLTLDVLNVEFAVGGRDVESLLALQKAFPAALTDALAARDVSVGTVSVTFGASGEATETALKNGAVQLAFLSAEDYLPYQCGELVALERGGEGDGARGLLVSAVAEEGFTDALRAALPDLAPVLAPYAAEAAAGVYEYDKAAADALLGEWQETNEA